MIRRTKADQLGKQLLAYGATIATDKTGESEGLSAEPILQAARQLTRDGIRIFNCYVRFTNNMELVYTKAGKIYKAMLTRLYVMLDNTRTLNILIDSETQRKQQPLIMTESQYRAWKDREPESEADEMEQTRAKLYGVAILDKTEGLSINSQGEYVQPDILEDAKADYGLSSFGDDAETLFDAICIIKELTQLMNYNRLIEIMADTLKLKEFLRWQLDLSNAINAIKQYNNYVTMLLAKQMHDDLLQLIFTADQRQQLKEILETELKVIMLNDIKPQETDESRETLSKLLEKLPEFDIYLARDYFTSYNKLSQPVSAIELLSKEAADA